MNHSSLQLTHLQQSLVSPTLSHTSPSGSQTEGSSTFAKGFSPKLESVNSFSASANLYKQYLQTVLSPSKSFPHELHPIIIQNDYLFKEIAQRTDHSIDTDLHMGLDEYPTSASVNADGVLP